MSIIQDALKKAGEPVISRTERPRPNVPSGKTEFRPEVERHRGSSVHWGPFFVISILLLITGPILVPLLYHPSRPMVVGTTPADTNRSVSMGNEVSAPSSLQGQFAIEEIPIRPVSVPAASATKPAGAPRFKLSGVVYSDKESYCLLNGRVLKTGEVVGGATVEKITPSEVWLSYNGERVVLPVVS